MALKATIFKADLQVSDLDRRHYASHALTIARHPSETDERMMMRVLAFALNADDALAFGKGVSTEDEPDLVRKDLTGAIEAWIDVGQPDERRIRRACGRAAQVSVYCYSGHGAGLWWSQVGDKLECLRNLSVVNLPAGVGPALAKLADRNMQLQFTIQEGQVWVSAGESVVHLEPEVLKRAEAETH